MSSKAKRLVNKALESQKIAKYNAENSLLGSIIITCAKTVGISEKKAIDEYMNKSVNINRYKNKWKCALDIVNYYIKQYKIPEDKKKLIHLVVDNKNVYTPLCTLVYEDRILPISDTGVNNGILLAMEGTEDAERYTVEALFD